MKNKLFFRVLGALASALIIVSVFVPFVNVTGYSPSLWQTHELTNSLYLPIMIIAFGAIGVIFFTLNVKTEFAYMSVGAISFFVIMQTIDILEQGVFSTLSIGYYFLVIGAVLTGIMAFLINLKAKKKNPAVVEQKKEETSVLDQIDKLYNEQTNNESEISPIQPVDSIVQPLPIQPLETVVPVEPIQTVEEKVLEEGPISPVSQELQSENIESIQKPVVEQVQEANEQINPVIQEFNTTIEPNVEEVPMVEQQPVPKIPVNQPVNPVLEEFGVGSALEVENTINSSVQQVNPIIQEFAPTTNPVIQEFGIGSSNIVDQPPVIEQQQTTLNQEVETIPLSNINEPITPTSQEIGNPEFIVNRQQNSTELDIFGQPINKS